MGWSTVWYSEIDPYASAVMKKHFPEAVNLGDITTIDGSLVAPVDLLCGGFPCQDISLAGKGAGLGGERSGLWSHYARLIGEVAPRWVVIENVSALRSRGLDQVLGRLDSLGYDAEWHCIPAAYVGAPHRRDRIWITAHARSQQLRKQPGGSSGASWTDSLLVDLYGASQPMADAASVTESESRYETEAVSSGGDSRLVPCRSGDRFDGRESSSALAHAASIGRREGGESDTTEGQGGWHPHGGGLSANVPDTDSRRFEECVQRDGHTIGGGGVITQGRHSAIS